MPVITTTTYICDGCGMEIAEGHFTLRLDHGSQYDGEHYEYVYCIPCCRIIRQALDELPLISDAIESLREA